MSELQKLIDMLATAHGGCAELDRLVADVYELPPAAYSESVDCCLHMVKGVLPHWRLHIGFGVSGILPYASLTQDDRHYEAEGPTVPLAVLRVLVKVPRS